MGNPEEALDHPETTVVYVASPPATHSGLATAAFELQKAVYCEKPLGVNVEDSRKLVERALDSGCKNIVNFSMASTTATQAAEKWLREGVAGDVSGVEIRIHFSQWPRKWQTGASGWLASRTQGGFVREVVSHWIYLTQRLFGRADDLHRVTSTNEPSAQLQNGLLDSTYIGMEPDHDLQNSHRAQDRPWSGIFLRR